MSKRRWVTVCLVLTTSGLIATEPVPSQPALATPPDRNILHIQVILDKLGFAPGVLDGHGGQSLTAALRGFQIAHDLPVTGRGDLATLRKLWIYRSWRPTRALVLDASILAGPFQPGLSKDPDAQAKLPALGYRNVIEALAERFHTTPETLAALNGPDFRVAAGVRMVLPNALPTSRRYPGDITPEWHATLDSLNVDANVGSAERVVVDKSEGVLRVYGAKDGLIAQFPATMGSGHDPLPIGRWTIKGISTNPPFQYNPKLFWDADHGDRKARLPPGPNGPVGVVWIDISKPHYGIHGTPEPSTIGRTESHGCIRLTNWDAARLALMVKAGVPAVFQP